MDNNMSLKFDAKPENESFARSTIAAFCVGSDPTLMTINDIRTAVSEAVTNCIVHAYDDEEKGEILIEANIYKNVLSVKISDYGKGIIDIEEAKKDFYTTRLDDERSGLGFTIMETFMDTMEVESIVGSGTTIILTKRLT